MTTDISTMAGQNYQQMAKLKLHIQALIASTMMERMLPNYLLFSQLTQFGEGKALRDALNIVWEKQHVKQLKLSTEKQLEKIEPNIPNIEDFDQFGVYPALDTAMALTCLLQGMGGDESGFVDVCKLSQASVGKLVELELSEQHDSLTDEQIHQHELMQYEVEFLAELIADASKLHQVNKSTVNRYKQRALADGITNIAIEV